MIGNARWGVKQSLLPVCQPNKSIDGLGVISAGGFRTMSELLQLIEGSGCFFYDKMIAPVLLMGKGPLPPRKAKHGVGSCLSESFK